MWLQPEGEVGMCTFHVVGRLIVVDIAVYSSSFRITAVFAQNDQTERI